MKKVSKLLLLVALLLTMTLPAWSQTSTQGKEFWVALIPSSSPDGANPLTQKTVDGEKCYLFGAYLAISAPKSCTVTVSNPNTGWSKSTTVGDNSWTELKTEMTAGDGGFIPLEQWYKKDGMPASEVVLKHGLKVEATEDVSVYCSLRWLYSMDASNILPVTALQSDYIVQTYVAAEGNGQKQNVFTILAAEDCTVDITPSVETAGGKTQPFSVDLKAGENYHVLSAETKNLSGSRVTARGKKKIAVFAGAPLNRVPNYYSDRDLLYEQLFPIDYWGQNFIVSRSKKKDANRVVITAQENGTQVIIYGKYDPTAIRNADHTLKENDTVTLDAGKSYEFELSAGNQTGVKWKSESTREAFAGVAFVDSTVFIKTSCPCAVLSYDVGNSYYRDDPGVETEGSGDNHFGAPAMTWVSPIEQMISDIVFGVMGTNKTTRHFINIIVETRDVQYTKLNEESIASYFKPVESNSSYSYARIKLKETQTTGGQNPFYHLKSKYGFVATVYGNGDDESYAYSVGSSAVKRAISVDGFKFTNNMEVDDILKQTYCVNNELTFDPQVGTDVIDTVVWDFGDGTTATTTKEQEITITHKYTSTGWYDIVARVSAHRDCPPSSYPTEEVSFTIRVVRPDTIIAGVAALKPIKLEDYKNADAATKDSLDNLVANGANDTVQGPNCYDTLFVYYQPYCLETEETLDTIVGQDSVVYNGKKYYVSTDVVDTTINDNNCPHYVHYYVKVKKCLKMEMDKSSESCPENNIIVHYTKSKGEIQNPVHFVVPGIVDTTFDMSNDNTETGSLTLPTASIKKPGFYHGTLTITDANGCDPNPQVFPIDFAVNYPDYIFDFKFTNVLAIRKDLGYNFRNYQWYINGRPVGGDVSVLYLGEDVALKNNDLVYVILTDYNGMVLKSCPQTIEYKDDQLQPNKATARKVMQNQRIYILRDEQVYDIFGQKVK